ncbi:MAG: low-complexity protein, partial [Cyanobacteria bacterium J083]
MSDYANSKSSLVFRAKRPLGEILVEAGLITPAQISVALSEQQQQVKLKIGEILVAHGWIEKKTIEFFVHDWQKILTNHKKKKKPLVYYFNKSGLINKQQINLILAEQKQRKEKVRFHTLAIEKRYIKPITVSFFLAYIFDIYINTSNLYYSLKPYEI